MQNKEQIWKKIVAAIHMFWLSLPKHTFYAKLKICQKQDYSLFQPLLFLPAQYNNYLFSIQVIL